MASTFTPNINLENQGRGDNAGTWDTAVDNDFTLIDLILGGVTTINMSAGSVVLSAAQFKSASITFNSTLTGNATVTFPSTFIKSYEIQNLCTGNFTITLQTTVAGGQVICAPPGEIVDCRNNGTDLKYKNLGRVGSYMDVCTATVPTWINGCTIPPYLNCNGTTFSSATYPALATFLGGTTLPDAGGRVRAAMESSVSARLTGVIANTVLAAGGDQNMQQHSHQLFADPSGGNINAPGSPFAIQQNGATGVFAATQNTGTGTAQNVQPTYRGGLTMIRAA